MANNLSFSVRLELLADKFRQQAEGAKNALRSIQFQALAMAGALGAGVTSLQGLLSSLIDTAREAGRARTVLRNVSQDAREYGQSIRFLSELSNKYGTDLIGLTDAFAKFKAAATPAGIAVAEQERIFSNISKAMASFGISGSEASLTMVAITQMMSKGKISSEELRRQLGERMPVAMQAMANAAGVSMEQLDKLLKEGKLRSADIMGKFSDELAKLSGETSTDNLEASLGRLKNSFTGLTDNLHIYDHFKTLIDKVKGLLEYLKDHLSNFYIWAGGLLATRLWGKFSNAWNQASAAIRASQARTIADDAEAKRKALAAAREAQKALADAESKVARAEAALASVSAPTPNDAKRLATAQAKGDKQFNSAVANFSKAQADYRQLTALHSSYLRGLEAKEMEVAQRVAAAKQVLATANATADAKAISEAQHAYDKVQAEASRLHVANIYKREEAEIRYASHADELQKKIAARGEALNKAQHDRKELLANAHAKNEELRLKKIDALKATLDKARSEQRALAPTSSLTASQYQSNVGRLNTQRAVASAGQFSFRPVAPDIIADQTQAATATASLWMRTATTFKVLWSGAVATVRSLMSTLVPLAIIGAITGIVTAMVDWYNKQKEINGLQAKYRADLAAVSTGHSEESQKLLRLFDTYKALHGQVEEQKTIQHQIERSLGLQEGALDRLKGKYEDIRTIIANTVKVKDLERQADFLVDTERNSRKHFDERRQKFTEDNPNLILSQQSMDLLVKAFANYDRHNQLQAQKELRAEGVKSPTINQLIYRTLGNAFTQQNGRKPNEAERKFLWQEVKSGFSYQDMHSTVANAKLILQSAKDRAETDKKVAEANVEYEQTLRSHGLLKGGKPSSEEGDTGKGKKSELQRTREAAEKDRLEIENQKAAGVYKSIDEYHLALDKVAKTHTERLASLLGAKAMEDKLYQQFSDLLRADRELLEEKEKSRKELSTLTVQVRHGIANEDELIKARAERAKAELSAMISVDKELDTSKEYVKARLAEIAENTEIAQLQREYAKQTKVLKEQREAGLLTEKEYQKELLHLIDSMRRKAIAINTPTEGEQERKITLQKTLKDDLKANTAIPQLKERDTTFDYKKKDFDKRKEERKLLTDYINELKKAEKAGLDVAEALGEVQKKATTLDQAVKLAELEGDLKKYQKSLNDKTVSGMKSIAQSAHNLKRAFDGLQKAFDPESNASAWEHFFAVFDYASQSIDTIMSLINMIEELKKVKEVAHAVEKTLNAEKIAQNTAVTASEVTSTSTEVGLSTIRTAATTVETKADTIGAAAKVAKAHAALPFVGVAIAGAAIGALLAMIASSANKVPKFASGGIVPGGDGSGDRVLARVNPGELILNKAQQGRLANHLTSSSAIRVEVEGRIRARDILQLSTVATRHKSR